MSDIETIVIEVRRAGQADESEYEYYTFLPAEARSSRYILTEGEELRIEVEE